MRKKLLKELERWYHEHPQGMTSRCKSKVLSQKSTIIAVYEGLPMDSGFDNEGGVLAAAAAAAATAAPSAATSGS